jgi:hypothetical protein
VEIEHERPDVVDVTLSFSLAFDHEAVGLQQFGGSLDVRR